jgi:DNA-directed RNA polymerase specialized sigma subunit
MPFALPRPRDVVDEVYLENDPDIGDLLDLAQAYAFLPRRWKRVLHELYHNDLYYREAGDKMGISHERVRQIHNKAVSWLRAYFDGEKPSLPCETVQKTKKGDAA